MRGWRKIGKVGLFLFGLLLTLQIAGCPTATITSNNQPLATVAAVEPPNLPDWIEQISPIGETTAQAQIRVRFKEPLIPVESLESPEQQSLLKKFELVPPLAGQFRFLTPRMVGFQADQAIPQATRVQVTLKAGLADLKNHRLDRDLTWTFQTPSIKLTNLPGSPPPGSSTSEPVEPFDIKPVLPLTSNVELDLQSLQEHTQLTAPGETKSVGLKVAFDKSEQPEEASSEEKFDPSARHWIYTLEPQQPLAKATRYRLEITPGVRPAKGNLVSTSSFVSQIQTYAPLAFQKLRYFGQPDAGGAVGRFNQGAPQLEFNNGLEAEAAIAHISIKPAPKEGLPLVQVYQDEKVANINPWALEPNSRYTLTIGADLKDRFGQTLGQAQTVEFSTSDIAADIWVPSGLNIFPPGKDLQLNLSTVNLPGYKAAFKVVQPADLVYTDSAYPRENGGSLLPDVATWKSTGIKSEKNQTKDIPIALKELLGGNTGMLAYGVQARTNQYKEDNKPKWREPTTYGLVQLTNLGVFAQWYPQSGMVRVHHLSDGSPAGNATVQVYQSQLEAKSLATPSPCATGKTDKTGTLVFNSQTLQGCMGGSSFVNAPNLLTIAQEGKDWAFTRTQEYSGTYEYGNEGAGWQSSKPESRGTIFSDRKLYQPGETGWFTGVAYYLQNGAIKQDKQASYRLTLRDPNGQEKDLGSKTTNDFGTFALELPIAKAQAPGFYNLLAKGSNGVELSGEFRVAEFKPPNFKVDLTLQGTTEAAGQAVALGNQTLEAKTQSNYLFGAPVEGGKVQYYVTRRQTEFSPQGWEGFAFGRQWYWPEEAPELSSDVLQVEQVLTSSGQGSQTLKVDGDIPYPLLYRVDAEVSDVSNLSVADSKSFIALPGDKLIGLQTEFVAEAGKAFPVKVIVSDPTGKPLVGQQVRLELQQMMYSRVTKVVEGSRVQRNQVEYKTVANGQVRSDVQPQEVTLTAPASGSYRIRASFNDGREGTATDSQIWATGNEAASWGSRYRNNRLEVKLDKKNYQPGDTATALIQSPYPEGELYFAVVRHKPIYQTVVQVKGGAPKIQFQVTPDMLPNAAVEAVLVRQGKPLDQVEPGSLDKLVRIGFAPFNTDLASQYLKVEATATPSLQPGEQQTIQLTLKDGKDQATQGQITLMVVNEAVLQLTGYRPPDLVQTVYAEQSISTRLSDNRPDVVLQPLASPLDKGWGYGGGYSLGAGNTRVRTDFRALAYYNGAILTDATGRATVSFKLPDDLTTWRVMAVATDRDRHFGNGETTFTSTRPLIANPLLPQFARPGDRFQVGVAVTNTTGQDGRVAVTGTVSDPLKLDNSGNTEGQLNTGTSAYRFPVSVQGTGEAKVKFSAQMGSFGDAFELPLELKTLPVTEQVVEAGRTDSQVKIPLNVDKALAMDVGGLEINLASSLIPTLTAPAKQVLDEQDLPFLEPAASQLAIAANLQTLAQTYAQTFAGFQPTQQAEQAIARLQRLQKPDGGFAAYPGQERSDPFVTPYAAQAIARANRVFGEKPGNASALTASVSGYLKKILADPGQYDFCKQQLCKNQVRLETLLALAELGDRRNDFLADLYQQRSQFDLVSQLKLARYLSQFPDWQQEAQTLTRQLQEQIAQTGRSATVNLPAGWGWLNSPTTAQAEALRLAIAQKVTPEVRDRLLQGLLNQRRNGTWPGTYNNALALTALVDYSQLQPTPPNFKATAQLAGKTLVSGQFEGYRKPSLQVTVPMAELPKDKNELVLQKTGQGALHYLAAFRYRLQGNQPGRLNGLRVTRTIRPANQEKALAKVGLYAPDALTLGVGQVYDIGLEIITDHAVDHVVITDPLPAGLEAVDNSFQTSTPYFQSRGDSWQLSYQTIYHDRVVAFGDRLEPGVYTLHYLVRSVTPGSFVYPGAEAHLQYAPEEFGRTAAATLVVSEK